ncbi:hypothetical protein R0135_02875 [Congregibacter variabilis]|uniref:Uncharacterized protein n=1 Tax=Congregibacter variabilis TaxID=3081200 RepID=A0ABZ0I4J6_9GAMM|nr:hypothetical protein R0135_02875 [Congregibacter sp. IMCC43200]
MTINWEAVAAVVELLGLALIVVSLVYLAIQTRSINKQAQSEARYAFVDAAGQINMVIAQDLQAASVFRRGLASVDDLNEDERMQFFMFVGQYANLWSVMHQSYADDVLPDTQWAIVQNDIRSILGSPGGRAFWSTAGAAAYDQAFVDSVNAELAKTDAGYDMVKMTAQAE